MLPDWVLLILLFVGIALVPLYTPDMTPLEYATGGISNLLQSGQLDPRRRTAKGSKADF
jgi:hypothetical protein